MPKYRVTIDGQSYEVNSPRELSDTEAHDLAWQQRQPTHAQPAGAPETSTEPGSYWGGFVKGLKNYAGDLVRDPKTMATVGAGLALASTPVTGPLGVAGAALLGGAGGAGMSHIAKQFESGPEDASDVLSSMGVEGAEQAAFASIPAAARGIAPSLAARAVRLGNIDPLARYAKHAAAGAATHFLGPGAGLAIEAAQSPALNQGAATALEGIGSIPEVASDLGARSMQSLRRLVTGGSETGTGAAAARIQQARDLMDAGYSFDEAAARAGVPRSTPKIASMADEAPSMSRLAEPSSSAGRQFASTLEDANAEYPAEMFGEHGYAGPEATGSHYPPSSVVDDPLTAWNTRWKQFTQPELR